MSSQPYRTLRILLLVFSALGTAEGLLLIISNKAIITLLFPRLSPEITTETLVMMKEWGGLGVMVGLMLYFAFRDPARNVAIIDGFAVGLCILGLMPLVSLYTLDVARLYGFERPVWVWAKALLRFGLAGLLYYLRPREALSNTEKTPPLQGPEPIEHTVGLS